MSKQLREEYHSIATIDDFEKLPLKKFHSSAAKVYIDDLNAIVLSDLIKYPLLTKFVGATEALLISVSLYLILQETVSWVLATTILTSWLVLKTVGSIKLWSSQAFGRASLYIFITGTTINAILAITLTFLFIYLK